jgi:hypothetical protein
MLLLIELIVALLVLKLLLLPLLCVIRILGTGSAGLPANFALG